LLGQRNQQPRCQITFQLANEAPFFACISGYDDGYSNEGRQAAFDLCMRYLKPSTSLGRQSRSAIRLHIRLYAKGGSDCLMIGLRLERIDEHGYFEANVGVAACQAMTIARTPFGANLLSQNIKGVFAITQPVGLRGRTNRLQAGGSNSAAPGLNAASGTLLPQRAAALEGSGLTGNGQQATSNRRKRRLG
jgi:hypothetical protein